MVSEAKGAVHSLMQETESPSGSGGCRLCSLPRGTMRGDVGAAVGSGVKNRAGDSRGKTVSQPAVREGRVWARGGECGQGGFGSH